MKDPNEHDEAKFQLNRKRMRAVADMLDILARFENESDRSALMLSVMATADARAEKLVDAQMREHFGRKP